MRCWRKSDFVSVHVPLMADTRGLFDVREIFADEADGVFDQYFAGAGGG